MAFLNRIERNKIVASVFLDQRTLPRIRNQIAFAAENLLDSVSFFISMLRSLCKQIYTKDTETEV